MKKRFLLFVVLSAVLVPLLVFCSEAGSSDGGNSNGGNSNGGKTVTYTVSFDSEEGSAVSPQGVKSGGKATRPADPQRSGYILENWYSDAQFQTVYNFDQLVTESITLYARWIEANLKQVISKGVIPADLSVYDSLVRAVLEPYTPNAAIVAKYVASTVQGTGDASSWENAAGNIKTTVDGVGADANTVYLVLLASGDYVPAATLAMKNHVAIVGGWNEWEQTGTSTISGGNARQVFSNNGIDRTALLYGVTIANGEASGTRSGGGMYNYESSPTLSNVTFVNNKANQGGSGMYNYESSPTLSNVTFVNNKANQGGGGMYNLNNSSPTLSNVTFVSNDASYGGGMFNQGNSSPTLINVTFVNNKALGGTGGGMRNDNDGGTGPTIVNTLFWNNTGGTATTGQQIYMYNDGSGAENMTISFSLVQHGIGATTSATADTDQSDGLGIVSGGSASVTVTQVHNISGDPKLAADLADNGGFVQTIALLDNSPAADAGVYVQRSGTPGSFTFYYSENNANWFSDAVLSSSGPAPPAVALDLTAADARGYARNGRPDIGAYEYGGTAP